jgi:hypothetical protein
MPLPRMRFTVRRLMVAVAVVAVAIAGIDLAHKAIGYRLAASRHAMIQHGLVLPESGPAELIERAKRHNDKLRAYHESLRRKYEFAASHPWLPVAPDPPEPE